MKMFREITWCLFLLTGVSLAQDEMRSSSVGRPDAVIFQDVDKRLTDNERNNSEVVDFNMLNINKTVISNENILYISNAQISKPDAAENSSFVVYNSSVRSTEDLMLASQRINSSFVIIQPIDLREEVNMSDNNNLRDVNETSGAEQDETIGSIIETDDNEFQLESSSQNVENESTEDPMVEQIDIVTDTPFTGNGEEVTVKSNSNDDMEKTEWSSDVTQYSDDYKTTIIFTNLYSPGEDLATDLPEKLEDDGNPKMKVVDDVLSQERRNIDYSSESFGKEKSDFDSDTRQNQMIREINARSEEKNTSPIFINNGHIGSGAAIDIKSNNTDANDQDEILRNNDDSKDKLVVSTKIAFPPIVIENEKDIPNKSFTQNSNSDRINADNSESNGEMLPDVKDTIVNSVDRSKWNNSATIPLKILPQRKDIKALIEERRRMSPQLTFRRAPSFRINSTRLNRETMKIAPRDSSDKLIEPLKNQSSVNESDGSVEVLPDIYEMERSLRISWGGCARECGTTPAMTCHYDLTLEWFYSMSKACFSCPRNISDCFRPHCIPTDGVMRTIAVINRSLPGPLIQVCEGDTVVAKVTNLMMESTTSIHWHGQHQLFTPHMDGVPSVTQCPIQPGASFTYSFTASQPGTHFYHSHSGVQRGDGAFGGLIIRRAKSKERHRWTYDQDLPEHTITILDWTHRLGLQTFTHHHHAGGPNKPDTILVNGRGIHANRELPPASFTVTKGINYRFRLINAGVLNCPIRISIDDHRLVIIAADGNDIQPYFVDWLVTYAGERWDFVVEAKANVSNYWMRFVGLMDCDERFNSAHQGAVLHYNGAPVSLPSAPLAYNTTIMSSPKLERPPRVLNALNAGLSDGTTLVHQLSGLARAQSWLSTRQPDKKLVLAYDFNPLDNVLFHKANLYGFSQVLDLSRRVYTPQLNHISLKLPPFPLLTQANMMTSDMLCSNLNQETCKKSYCECTNIIDIPLGSVVEIIFIDQGFVYDANHPFHLHGHSFYVIGMDRLGRNVTSERVLELDNAGLLKRNLGAPPLKDTVTVPDGGYTIIRFLANNPGYWLLHCHIDFHVEVGMAVVLRIGQTSDIPPPPRGFPTCGDFDPTLTNLTDTDSPDGNSLEQGVVSLLDTIVNPSFGSRWKYNMSSSISVTPSSLYTTLCAIAVLLLTP